ncbi:hypothetical protein MKEN_00700400 [Mycena kentingensis (nom. inval.)]|nr:hypothetical protein MKEN_00700400 [Mycena kentingensis (nom. inval.)]
MALAAILPVLYWVVGPIAVLLLPFAVLRRRQNNLRPKKSIAWGIMVVVSFAGLSVGAGVLLLLRQRRDSFALALANSVVTSALYMELNFSTMYMLSVLTPLPERRPILFLLYCVVLTTILIAAMLVSIVSSFRPMPPLLPPLLYLAFTVLTLPVIAFYSFFNPPQPSSAPQFLVAPPRSSTEKPRLFDETSFGSSPRPRSSLSTAAAISVLCAQTVAIAHFGFAVVFCVQVPDVPSLNPTLAPGTVPAPLFQQAIALQASQIACLVIWLAGTILAFLQLYSRSGNGRISALRSSSLTSGSEATVTAFTNLPSSRPARIKFLPLTASRSSSFSSPRPRRNPLQPRLSTPPVPRRPSPIDDFRDLKDPFAPALGVSVRTSQATGSTAVDEPRPTRMSAWGTLPTAPPPSATQQGRENVRRLPSLRALGLLRGTAAPAGDADARTSSSKGTKSMKRRSMSIFTGYTSPSAYSQDGEGDDGFDMEEALLAQKLLQRLDAAASSSSPRRWRRS